MTKITLGEHLQKTDTDVVFEGHTYTLRAPSFEEARPVRAVEKRYTPKVHTDRRRAAESAIDGNSLVDYANDCNTAALKVCLVAIDGAEIDRGAATELEWATLAMRLGRHSPVNAEALKLCGALMALPEEAEETLPLST